MPVTDALVAYIDGGSRGNPGPAGFGVRIETPDGGIAAQLHEAIGVATNNVAEYRGLLAALTWALDHHCSHLHVRSDSQLLVCQMRGEYRVKNPGLRALHHQARELVDGIGHVTFEHVPRSQNQDADRLANLAMDEAAGLNLPDDGPATSTTHTGRRAPDASGQSTLPFDEDLPDNAPHSAGRRVRTNRKPGQRET